MSELMFYLAHHYDKSKGQYIPFLYTNIAQNVLLNAESEETVADALTQLQSAKGYTLSELYAHIGNADVHSSAGQIQNVLAAISDLMQHASNNNIHVLITDKNRWDAGETTAKNAYELAFESYEKGNQHENRIACLEDSIFNNITGNPFLIAFDNLSGISIIKGVWNREKQRVEC